MTGNEQWKVGDVTVTMVIERSNEMAAENFIPGAAGDALARHREWLRPWAVSDAGHLRFVMQALCLETSGQKIIVDTCIGPRQLPEIYAGLENDGSFIDALTAAGFGRDDVDLVISTHLHFDHVGWNTFREDGHWVPTFRGARYVIARPEYEHWLDTPEEDRAHETLSTGVLAHTLTFHEPARADRWLLISNRSLHAGGGRGYGEGHVFTQDGQLVASFVQQNMIRYFRDEPGVRGKAAGAM